MVFQMNAVGEVHMIPQVVADGAILLFEMVANTTTGLIFDGDSMDSLGHDQKQTKTFNSQ